MHCTIYIAHCSNTPKKGPQVHFLNGDCLYRERASSWPLVWSCSLRMPKKYDFSRGRGNVFFMVCNASIFMWGIEERIYLYSLTLWVIWDIISCSVWCSAGRSGFSLSSDRSRILSVLTTQNPVALDSTSSTFEQGRREPNRKTRGNHWCEIPKLLKLYEQGIMNNFLDFEKVEYENPSFPKAQGDCPSYHPLGSTVSKPNNFRKLCTSDWTACVRVDESAH